MPRRFHLLAAALLLLAQPAAFAAPSPLAHEHDEILRIINSDPTAKELFNGLKEDADAALKDTPNPIKTIVSEGKLGSDPARIRTYESLPDMDKIDALRWAAVVTGDQKYLAKLHAFLLAWGGTNVSEGNPINDMKVEAAFTAYGDFRSTFSDAERTVMDHWLSATAHSIIDNIHKRSDVVISNWQSHRLKMIGIAAFILDDAELKQFAIDHYKQQIADNLRPNGSSFDFEERDALHYHCYDLEPLLTLAIVADRHGVDLYSYVAPSGASLPKSVAFLIPFVDGTKPHPEFLHSKVEFDRQRAASGDSSYKAGRPFDPHVGYHSLELAAYFDPTLVPLFSTLTDHPHTRYPSWQIVLNDVDRPRRSADKAGSPSR